MKSKLALSLLLAAISLLPGCYTILLTTNTDEDVISGPNPIPTVDPGLWPTPPFPPDPPRPKHHPIYVPPTGPVSQIPVTTAPDQDERRLTTTGRGPVNPVPQPTATREDQPRNRDTGVRKGQ